MFALIQVSAMSFLNQLVILWLTHSDPKISNILHRLKHKAYLYGSLYFACYPSYSRVPSSKLRQSIQLIESQFSEMGNLCQISIRTIEKTGFVVRFWLSEFLLRQFCSSCDKSSVYQIAPQQGLLFKADLGMRPVIRNGHDANPYFHPSSPFFV